MFLRLTGLFLAHGILATLVIFLATLCWLVTCIPRALRTFPL
jgi:hypothetical protein